MKSLIVVLLVAFCVGCAVRHPSTNRPAFKPELVIIVVNDTAAPLEIKGLGDAISFTGTLQCPDKSRVVIPGGSTQVCFLQRKRPAVVLVANGGSTTAMRSFSFPTDRWTRMEYWTISK